MNSGKTRRLELPPRQLSHGDDYDRLEQRNHASVPHNPEVRAQLREMAERIARLEADQAPPDYRSNVSG
ncbi:hypothetical protein PM082_012517 [Marasmius tenuissimus]|nr:hypothetical protein PM082_012517 [Marasmius tenuissimus]